VIPTNAAAVEQLFPDRRSRISCNQAATFPELAWISQPEQLFILVAAQVAAESKSYDEKKIKKTFDNIETYC
tara:strand:+ start:218 stop:433 length:216 start_codon:yes stop_codon:yes gene_type:complete